MADTGAPWNIPYAEPAELVRDWPALSEDVAEAVAAGLSLAGGLVEMKHVVKTNTFSASLTTGENAAVTDLSITHEVADVANKLVLIASLGVVGSSDGLARTGVAFHDGTGLIGIGDAEGNRTRVGAGGQNFFDVSTGARNALHLTLVHVPGAGSKTYTVRLVNPSTSTITHYAGRNHNDGNDAGTTRGASTFVLMEVRV
jgi:hypothetical protein